MISSIPIEYKYIENLISHNCVQKEDKSLKKTKT